jgi:hypothetical protein
MGFFRTSFYIVIMSSTLCIASAIAEPNPAKPSCSDNSLSACEGKQVGAECPYPGFEGGKGFCSPDDKFDCKCVPRDSSNECRSEGVNCTRPGYRCKSEGKPGVCVEKGTNEGGIGLKCECDTDALSIEANEVEAIVDEALKSMAVQP